MARKKTPKTAKKAQTPRKATTITAQVVDTGSADATPRAASKSTGPLQFIQQVRSEAEKVTWTSRNETLTSTIMVLIMVALASTFFFLVDQVYRTVMPLLLSL